MHDVEFRKIRKPENEDVIWRGRRNLNSRPPSLYPAELRAHPVENDITQSEHYCKSEVTVII